MLNLHISIRDKKREKDSRTAPIPNSETSPPVMVDHQSSYLAWLIVGGLKASQPPIPSIPNSRYFWSPKADPWH